MRNFKINKTFISIFYTLIVGYLVYHFLWENAFAAYESKNTILIGYYIFFAVFLLAGVYFPLVLFGEYEKFKDKTSDNKKILKENGDPGVGNPVWKAYKDSFHGKDKTRANADLYFNTGSVMDEISPFFYKSFHFISDTFIGLGILGTFLGFSMGMEYINDSNNAINEIMHLVSTDFKTAFDTSIVGIVLSIIYKFMIYNPVIRELDKYFRDLSDELDNEFYMDDSTMFKDFSKDIGECIGTFSENMRKTLLDFSEDISEELQKAVIEGIQPQLEILKDSILMVAEKSETVSNRLAEIPGQIETIYQKIEKEVDDNIEMINGVMNGITGRMNTASEKLKEVPGRLDDAFRAVAEGTAVCIGKLKSQLDESYNRINEIAVKLQEIPDLFEKISDNIIEDNETYRRDMSKSVGQLAVKFREEISNSTDVMKEFKMELEKFNEVPEKFNEINEEYARQMSNKLNFMRDMNNEFSKNYREIASEVDGVAKEFRDNIIDTANKIGRAHVDGIKNQLEGINAELEPVMKKWKENIGSLDETSEKLIETLKQVESSVKDLSELENKNFSNIKDAMNSEQKLLENLDRVTTEAEKIIKGFDSVDKSIGGIFEKINSAISDYINRVDSTLRDVTNRNIPSEDERNSGAAEET